MNLQAVLSGSDMLLHDAGARDAMAICACLRNSRVHARARNHFQPPQSNFRRNAECDTDFQSPLRYNNISLGPRPSPLRDLLRAFNCAGEGNIENGPGAGEGLG